jgi:hypothetical protein
MSENLKKTVTFNVDNIEIIMVEKNSSYSDDDTLVNEFNKANIVEKNSLCSNNNTPVKKSYVFEDAFVKTKYFWWRF